MLCRVYLQDSSPNLPALPLLAYSIHPGRLLLPQAATSASKGYLNSDICWITSARSRAFLQKLVLTVQMGMNIPRLPFDVVPWNLADFQLHA